MFKSILSNSLRTLGLLELSDRIRFYLLFIRKLEDRQNFVKENSGIQLPPAYLIYESYKLNYHNYFFDGKNVASWLVDICKEYIDLKNSKILDWGCGPARVVRHLSSLLDSSNEIYGTDYNRKTIEWNRKYIGGVKFYHNKSIPPLGFPGNFFHVIYGISIFTHLPEDLHYQWFDELVRVSRDNALIVLTTQGSAFADKLTPKEKVGFNQGKLVVRGNTKIGHRTYSAFHPTDFIQKLFRGHEIIKFIEGHRSKSAPEQDIWIIKVKKV